MNIIFYNMIFKDYNRIFIFIKYYRKLITDLKEIKRE